MKNYSTINKWGFLQCVKTKDWLTEWVLRFDNLQEIALFGKKSWHIFGTFFGTKKEWFLTTLFFLFKQVV